VARAVALGQVEDLVERRHAGAGRRLLRGGELVAGRGRVARAAVERLGLGQREVLDELADEVVGAGVLALEREDPRLVRHEDLAVLGDRGVELERRHVELERLARAPRGREPLGTDASPTSSGWAGADPVGRLRPECDRL